MGRREVPVDPGAGPVQRFACDLRGLRAEAGGLTYRVMARKAGYSVTTLSQAAAGEQLPTLAVVLAYARACGAKTEQWEARWRAAVEECAAEPAADGRGAEPPYRGLARFETGDSARFFGREQLTGDLVGLLRRHRFAAVFGPSGSGKSSLLRAGLVPALRHPRGPGPRLAAIRILTPGPHPARTHAGLLAPAHAGNGTGGADGRADSGTGGGKDGTGGAEGGTGGGKGSGAGSGADTLVIVDQFEEVFTRCRDAAERARFIDLLLTARSPGSRLRVLLAVRADFYGHCAGHRELAAALREAQILAGPMSTAELRAAIVRPAAAAGLTVQRALTSRLVDEVADAPGGLPLLSHVLLETWRRRRGSTLTMAGYEAAGGLNGAIAQTAEGVHGRFTDRQARLARAILLRLVTPGDTTPGAGRDATPDTSRSAERDELPAAGPGQVDAVLDRLACARLITLDGSTVHLAHEALIHAWPRLRSWIDEDRERLRARRGLTEAARVWRELGRDPGALYRGSRLAVARELLTGPEADLTGWERAFLDAGVAAAEAERRAATRAARRLRSLVAGLGVLLVCSLLTAALAVDQRHDAVAASQRALSRQLAAQSLALHTADADLAALLAVRAYRTSPTTEAAAAVYAAGASPLRRTRALHDGQNAAAFSPDGRTVVAYGGQHAELVSTATGRTVTRITNRPADAVAFSADGRSVGVVGGLLGRSLVSVRDARTGQERAALDRAREAFSCVVFTARDEALAVTYGGRVWDVAGGRPVARLDGYDALTQRSQVSADGRTLTAVGRDGAVRVWNLAHGGRPARSFTVPHFDAEQPTALSTDGHTVAVARPHGAVDVWDTRTRHVATVRSDFDGHTTKLELSADGTRVAAAGDDYVIRWWNVRTGIRHADLLGHTGAVTSLAFAPDGGALASASRDDGTLRLWQADEPVRKAFPLHGGRTNATALSPDGRFLVVAHDRITPRSLSRTVRTWNLATDETRILSTGTYSGLLAVSPDARTLAEQSWPDARVTLRDIASGRRGPTVPAGWARDAGFSADGRLFGLVDLAGEVRVWDTRDGELRAGLRPPDRAASAVALSPDGRLAAVNDGPVTRLWDLEASTAGRTIETDTVPTLEPAARLAFSPDGRTLATTGRRTVSLWDVATGRSRTVLGARASALSFSPDGSLVATAERDGTVRLWDTGTGSTRATLHAASPAIALAFAPDGRTLTTEHDDHTVTVWNTDLPDLAGTLDTICRAAGGDQARREQSLRPSGSTSEAVCP